MTDVLIQSTAVEDAVRLHRDLCPGLATGIQAARLALETLAPAQGPHELLAVAESDTCAIDGIQAVTGCTLGNRNLIHLDHGKNVFTFFRLSDGRAIRLSGEPPWSPGYQAFRRKVTAAGATDAERAKLQELTEAEAHRILSEEPSSLFTVEELEAEPPVRSTVDPWLTCAECGEAVMETRSRRRGGRELCLPCFDAAGRPHSKRKEQ
jgi:formylmethanofuran dehydrogenase subunit E